MKQLTFLVLGLGALVIGSMTLRLNNSAFVASIESGALLAQAMPSSTNVVWSVQGPSLGQYDGVSVAFAQNGNFIAYGYQTNIQLRSAADGSLIREIPFDNVFAYKTVIAVSPDGSLIAAGGRRDINNVKEGVIKVWRTDTGELVKTLTTRVGAGTTSSLPLVGALDFSPDGQYLVSGGYDGLNTVNDNNNYIRIWKVADWSLSKTIVAESSSLYGVKFSSDGSKIVTASTAGARLYSTTGTVLKSFPLSGGAISASISSDGSKVAATVGGQYGGTKVFDAATGAVIKSYTGDYYSFASKFTNAPSMLLVADVAFGVGNYSRIFFWNIDNSSNTMLSLNLARVADSDMTPGISSDGSKWSYVLRSGVVELAHAPSAGDPSNAVPTVSISSPQNGSSVNQGTSVQLAGTATDPEDGALSSSIAWQSSIDGALGTGAAVQTSSLSAGTHTITARVTDSGGKVASASVTLTVVGADAAISITPTSIGFGSISTKRTSTQTFTIANTGQAPLVVSSITSSDAARFKVSPTSATIAPGTSKAISVTFAPGGGKVGTTITGTIKVSHNATNETSPSWVSVQGIRAR